MKNACANYRSCLDKERKDIRYPTDPNSLYGQGIYDNQVALRRCYEKYPIEIVEGFSATWDNFLKIAIVILLVFAFIALAKDFLVPHQEITVGVESVSPVEKMEGGFLFSDQ